MNPSDSTPAIIDDGHRDFDFCLGHRQMHDDAIHRAAIEPAASACEDAACAAPTACSC